MKKLLKREATLSYVKRQMREEMDRVWKDFFEKNPEEKERGVRALFEERLRSKQNSEDQDKVVLIAAQNA